MRLRRRLVTRLFGRDAHSARLASEINENPLNAGPGPEVASVSRVKEAAMCVRGRLVADFEVGTTEAPDGLPKIVARSLTQTVDEHWVVWATKVAWIDGEQFRALTGSEYPWDAVASCHRDPTHSAPDRFCTCGF